MLKLTLASGEVVHGEPNYVTVKVAEIRLADGSFRTIDRAQITSATRPKRKAASDA